MTAMYWTTTEIQVLLEVTLQYKEEKSRQNIDWRSHTSTYHDIWKAFLQVYPVKRAEEGVLHFPHDVDMINKSKVIFRLMDMRRRFHKQLDKHNFYYRFWGICEKIWGEEEQPCEENGEDRDVVVEEKEEVDSKESRSRDWSSIESEDETEMLEPLCKKRLFEVDVHVQHEHNALENEERHFGHLLEEVLKTAEKLNRLAVSIINNEYLIRQSVHPGYNQLQPWPFNPQNMVHQAWPFTSQYTVQQAWPFASQPMVPQARPFASQHMVPQAWSFTPQDTLPKAWAFAPQYMVPQAWSFAPLDTLPQAWSNIPVDGIYPPPSELDQQTMDMPEHSL